MNRRLGSGTTCVHLTVGTTAQSGRYYPRCALGTAAERAQWLEVVSPMRLERMRILQDEFDRFSWPLRERLHEARAAATAIRPAAGSGERLHDLLDTYLEAVAEFLRERSARFAEAGLPVAELMPLIERWTWAWARNRGHDSGAGVDRLGAFAPSGLAEPRSSTGEVVPPGSSPPQSIPVFADGLLRITRTVDPPRLHLIGEVDASNVDALTGALRSEQRARSDIDLDLGGLTFCDLSGIRAIVGTALTLPAGRRLVLHRTPPHVRKTLGIVGWADIPSLSGLAPEAMDPV